MTTKEYSFWNLISLYNIEIPAIQRDYAQGRKKEIKIASSLISDIYDAITSDASKTINLHFVYGKTENGHLIPLDGQQRLTTLFLLHWFLSLGNLSESDRKILAKFTYETRPSSEDFCHKLVKEDMIFSSELNVSEQIIDAKWFFLSWKNDPTIAAMLNMLDIIQSKFIEPDIDLFNKLKETDSPIQFHFLPLERFKLDDKIYVKMNSRGKPLSEFENFKSNFSILFDIDSRSKLDNEWLDIFWVIEKDKTKINISEVDTKYLNFIRNATFNFYTETFDLSKDTREKFDIFEQYKSVYNNRSESLNQLAKILDSLTGFTDIHGYFHDFLEYDPGYGERLRFYAKMQFFIKKDFVTTSNNDLYLKWIRVCNNLINNTLIQSPDTFSKALRSIKDLSNHIDNLYNFLIDNENKVEGFLQKQVEEERLKAQLILEDSRWVTEIQSTEDHSYFAGQIGFIIEYSNNDGEIPDLELFKEYSEKLKILFGDSLKDKYNCLFQRSLLTFGDYSVKINNCKTFCTFNTSLREKQDNWRKVFESPDKKKFLKDLLDSINLSSIVEDLNFIIDNYQDNNWRSLFIKNEGVMEYCDKFRIAKWNNKIALSRSEADNWRRHGELYSYVLYQKLKKDGYTVYYNDSSDDVPWVNIKWNEKLYYVQEDDLDYSFGLCEGNQDREGLEQVKKNITDFINHNKLVKVVLV